MERVRIGIVGLGRMGLHHVRCALAAKGVELAGVFDVAPAKADSLPKGVRFFPELEALLEASEAIVLAIPTDRHEKLGLEVLSKKRHLLVEKPLAATEESCRRLDARAQELGLVLGVGHVERMNGAIFGLEERIGIPRFIEGHRLAAFDPRGTEVDVVLDLMIHDLDLVMHWFQSEPEHVEAVGVAVLTDRVDIANARLEFANRSLVNLTASRVSREPMRKLRIFQDDAYLSMDFHAQRTEIFLRDRSIGSPGVTREVHERSAPHNPLILELEEFAASVRGESSRMVTAREGARAVALGARVLESIRERRRAFA